MFKITGTINGIKQSLEYKWEDGIGSYNGDILADFKMRTELEYHAPIGPVGQLMERDLDEPLAAFCMMLECFDKVDSIEGEIPKAAELPNGVIG